MKTYIIYGNPIPKARHGNNKGRTYDPQSKIKESVAWNLKYQHGQVFPMKGPLRMVITFFMPIPQSFSKIKQETLVNTPHYKKPDTSNLEKFYEDCGNGILYYDDAQISQILSTKIYSRKPRTEITIEQIKEFLVFPDL